MAATHRDKLADTRQPQPIRQRLAFHRGPLIRPRPLLHQRLPFHRGSLIRPRPLLRQPQLIRRGPLNRQPPTFHHGSLIRRRPPILHDWCCRLTALSSCHPRRSCSLRSRQRHGRPLGRSNRSYRSNRRCRSRNRSQSHKQPTRESSHRRPRQGKIAMTSPDLVSSKGPNAGLFPSARSAQFRHRNRPRGDFEPSIWHRVANSKT
jgi:hypothetical protein